MHIELNRVWFLGIMWHATVLVVAALTACLGALRLALRFLRGAFRLKLQARGFVDAMLALAFSTQQTPLNQEEWLSRHPFYRLPDLLPGVEVRNFDWRRPLLSSAIVRHVPQRLTDFQRLINKQALSQEDVDRLTHTVWDLLRFASSTKSRSLAKPIGELLEPLSLRFLIADALWCACELFGK